MPNEWVSRSLGELGEFRNGVNFNRSQEGPGIPVLKVKDFGELVACPLDGLDELDSSAFHVSTEQLLQDRDIVIVRSNGNSALVGRSVLVRGVSRPTTFTGFCIRFRVTDPSVDPQFVAYTLRSPRMRDRLARFGSGTGIQNLNQGILGQLPLEVPPLPEQRAIAGVLGALDDKIEQNRRTAQALERLARAIFRAWFVDFEPVKAKAEGATSFPSMPQHVFDTLPTTFVDSEIGPIPEGWEVKAVLAAFEINPVRRLHKGEVAPYLDMKNMPIEGHAPASWATRAYSSGMRFTNGDTLVARITPCLENGKTAFVDFLADGQVAWGSTEYIVLRPRPPLPPIYAYCLARTSEFREYAIQNMSGTSGRQRVAPTAMDHLRIAVPSDDVAAAFGDAVNPMFACIRAGMNESRKLAEMRDYLLPRLLNGEVRVQETGDPATACTSTRSEK